MSEGLVDDDRVAALPASATLVYLVLDKADTPLPHGKIAARAPVSGRTVRRALARLQAADVVESVAAADHPDHPLYRLRDK
jgi:predicted ArsR family transcriptional regulator